MDAAAAVRTAWTSAVTALGGCTLDADVDDLLARYRQPHRRYHTLEHVAAVLQATASLDSQLDGRERAHVALAACGHDVVYDGQPGADEQASAGWIGTALRAAGVGDDDATRVAHLVLRTVDHTADPADAVAAVLLDADLAVLASPPVDYERYVAAVRAEYDFLPDERWRAGRAAVLRSLLERNKLYLGDAARQRWQDRARVNLRAELARLER